MLHFSFFFFFGPSLCYDKMYNLNPYSVFSENNNSLRRAFKIYYLKQTIALNLTPQLSFCWEKYKNSRAVILLLALSHQDTRVFLGWDQSARAELLRAEKSSWSLWTHAGLLRTENRFPSLSSSKGFMLSWTPSFCLLGPTFNKWLKKWLQTWSIIFRLE